MPTWSASGTVSRESLLVGEWTELYAVVGGITLRIGCVKSGKLNIRRKFLVHRGKSKFGEIPDRMDCVDVRMTFEGRLDEVHRENILLLLNRPPDEADVPADGDDPAGRLLIPSPHYPEQFFTLYGRRPYAETGEDLVFVMWKCRSADFVRLGSIRDGMRFKAVALNDKWGNHGGSASQPYGWVYGYDASPAPPVTPQDSIRTHPTLTDDLVLHYSMEDDAANTVVTDDSPNNYHGVASRNTNFLNDPDGLVDDCFLFNGSSDFITLPDIRGEFTTEASVCMWLKLANMPPPVGSKTGLCDLGKSPYPSVTAYPFTDSKFYYDIFRSNRPNVSLAGGVDETAWHLLTITTTPGANQYIIYQNAVPIKTDTGLVAVYFNAVQLLGRSNSNPPGVPNYFDGRMDQVALWNRVLTPAEITDYYNGGAGLTY